MKYKDSNGQWQTIKVKNYGIEQTPIGSMIYYPSQNIPAGYLVCDGSEKLIADYPLLFNAIGYIGGEDVDTGYFRLPDMRGVVPGGYNSTLSSESPLYGQFGDQVGAPTHQLTIDEMPSHVHTQDGYTGSAAGAYFLATCNGTGTKYTDTAHVKSNGGDQPHSIVQPTMLYHWLIKAKNVVTLGGYTEDFEVVGDLNVLGKLIMPEDKLASSGGAIDMRNSDIVNANSICMGDEADSTSEGILFLKQGVTPGSSSYTDYECLRGYRGKLYYNENPVVDRGSNSNGTWVKWMDGTMLCYMNKVIGNVDITAPWGSMYETSSQINLGNYPQSFIETPSVSIMPMNTFFVEKSNHTTSNTSWGGFWPCRPESSSGYYVAVSCIAIGRWK